MDFLIMSTNLHRDAGWKVESVCVCVYTLPFYLKCKHNMGTQI